MGEGRCLYMNAEEGGVLTFPSGTKLEIPANAFLDAQGNPVTGKVEIAYREFHDAGTIFIGEQQLPLKKESGGWLIGRVIL